MEQDGRNYCWSRKKLAGENDQKQVRLITRAADNELRPGGKRETNIKPRKLKTTLNTTEMQNQMWQRDAKMREKKNRKQIKHKRKKTEIKHELRFTNKKRK